jgi:hypothetical protein
MPGLQQLLGGTGLVGIYRLNKRILMSVKKAKPVPGFVSLRDFCRSAGIYYTLATHLIELGALVPDGLLGGKPIFSADLQTLAQAKAAISVYKLRKKSAHQKIRGLSHA